MENLRRSLWTALSIALLLPLGNFAAAFADEVPGADYHGQFNGEYLASCEGTPTLHLVDRDIMPKIRKIFITQYHGKMEIFATEDPNAGDDWYSLESFEGGSSESRSDVQTEPKLFPGDSPIFSKTVKVARYDDDSFIRKYDHASRAKLFGRIPGASSPGTHTEFELRRTHDGLTLENRENLGGDKSHYKCRLQSLEPRRPLSRLNAAPAGNAAGWAFDGLQQRASATGTTTADAPSSTSTSTSTRGK